MGTYTSETQVSQKTSNFFSNPSPDTGLWRPWIEEGQYLEIGDSLLIFDTYDGLSEPSKMSLSDASPRMDMSKNMVARIEFWKSICGVDGCPSGSGI